MNKRTEHIKEVNRIRSESVKAMLYLLEDLEAGKKGDYDGFIRWGILGSCKLKGQLNSYRAEKIAKFLGKNISKQKLLKFSKPKDYVYSVTNKELDQWLINNKDGLERYSYFNEGVFIHN